MVSSSSRCQSCGAHLVWASTGRPRRFCGSTCRSRAHRARPRQLVIDQVLVDVDDVPVGPPLDFVEGAGVEVFSYPAR